MGPLLLELLWYTIKNLIKDVHVCKLVRVSEQPGIDVRRGVMVGSHLGMGTMCGQVLTVNDQYL